MSNKNKILEQVKEYISNCSSEESVQLFQNLLDLLKNKQNSNHQFYNDLFSEGRINQYTINKSKDRFQFFFDHTIEGIIIHKKGLILDVNPAIENMFNLPRELLNGRNILDFIHKNYCEKIKTHINSEECFKEEIILQVEGGSVIPVRIESNFWELKDSNLNVITILDISERKEAEKSVLKFYTAVFQSPSAIVITDTNGTIEYVNPQFTNISGYSLNEAIGQNPRLLKANDNDPEIYKSLWETITNGNIWKGEIHNKRKDGTYFWEKAIISPIKDEDGKIINYLAIKEDITQRKIAELEFASSQKKLEDANKTKDKFFSIIAHDLKNPFNIILGFSDLLLQNHKEYDIETRESVIKTIYEISLKTFNLLENLLAWSRSKSGNIPYHPKNIDIKLIVFDSVSLFKEAAEKKYIKITINILDDFTIFADRDMIAAVIRNLTNNAIKFTPRNGKIIVSASKFDDNYLAVSVKDSGIGIKKEKLDILFNIDRDWSTPGTEDEAGTGLGLFLCKEFVEKNGGKIYVKSEVNAGTEFIFTIPVPSE